MPNNDQNRQKSTKILNLGPKTRFLGLKCETKPLQLSEYTLDMCGRGKLTQLLAQIHYEVQKK